MSSKIKKTKRLHQLYQDWLKIKEMPEPPEIIKLRKEMRPRVPSLWEQPMAGKWYYEYRNDKGGYVGLAKLQDHNFSFTKGYSRKWMWETCTTNEGLELHRFPTQKAAEIEIYKFLGGKR